MVFKVKNNQKKNLIKNISLLYGEREAPIIYKSLEEIMKKYSRKIKSKYFKKYFDEKDVVLITYGDNIINGKNPPLETLSFFLKQNLKDAINTIHIIGLFLYSSDRGFSIVDYKKINPRLGNLNNLKKIEKNFKLMIDFVCNHTSTKSEWFKNFEKGIKGYENFFIAFNKKPAAVKISKVFRPRTSNLFVYRKINNERKWLWRTFCHDQMDLNYHNPAVFLKMVDVFLFYVENRAEFIRLDAIAYIWKKLNTGCFLTKESHIFVQTLRQILDVLSSSNDLVAEINTEFEENIKYLGNGKNEAQIIYNFPLSVLVLSSFYNKNTVKLLKWLETINLPSEKTTLFNMLDCHDGISVVGANDILGKKEINKISGKILINNGKIGYKECQNKEMPYEFNITWWSAINEGSKYSEEIKIKRYIATRGISFSLKGIPTIYFLGLFGIENCINCFKKSGKTRDINRRNFSERQINYFLDNKKTKEYKVFKETCHLLKIRNKEKSFHPAGNQKILLLKKTIFSIVRTSPNKKENILVLINISDKKEKIKINREKINKNPKEILDILSGNVFNKKQNSFLIELEPYQTRWIKY